MNNTHQDHDHNHDHDHDHDHGHHHHHLAEGQNILWAFALNFVFSIIEFFGGYFTNSVAIYSDALHDLGDSFSLLFAYFAEKMSLRVADHKFTFGYRRISVVSALVNGIILFGGSLYIIIEAFKRFQSPEAVHAPGMIALAILGISVNGFAAWKLSRNEGINSRMVSLHLLEDILGWVAVLIVSITLLFKPWFFLDSVLSILISFVILKGVYKNFLRIGSILLQSFPAHLNRDDLTREIAALNLVEDVHLVQGWSLDDSHSTVTLHIKVSEELKIKEVDHLRHEIETLLAKKKISYSTIQFESNDCSTVMKMGGC